MATNFGMALREYRLREKLSLEEMAQKLGTTKQALSRYERGERQPKITVAAKISEILGIPMSELAGGTEYSSAEPIQDDVIVIKKPKSEKVITLMQNISQLDEEDADQLNDMFYVMFAKKFKKGTDSK